MIKNPYNFRGKLASASLKRFSRRERLGMGRQNFRGKLASASLKQAEVNVRGQPKRINFRGKLASASLKHDIGKYSPVDIINFRGKLASASLKHPNRAALRLPQGPISEVNLPRPH